MGFCLTFEASVELLMKYMQDLCLINSYLHIHTVNFILPQVPERCPTWRQAPAPGPRVRKMCGHKKRSASSGPRRSAGSTDSAQTSPGYSLMATTRSG